MNEIIIDHPVMEISGFKSEVIFLIMILTLLFVHYCYMRFFVKSNQRRIDISKLKWIYLVASMFFILLHLSIIGNQLMYLVEYKFDNTEKTTEYIAAVSGNNQGIYLIDSKGKKYHFISMNRELFSDLNDNYLREQCYIEYYKYSGYVISIRFIEIQ